MLVAAGVVARGKDSVLAEVPDLKYIPLLGPKSLSYITGAIQCTAVNVPN